MLKVLNPEIMSIMEIDCLFAFDYEPPKPRDRVKRLLYIHSFSDPSKSQTCLRRLMEIYPAAEVHVLKRSTISFLNGNGGRVQVTDYTQSCLPGDYHRTEAGRNLLAKNFDLVFFGIGPNFNETAVALWTAYGNLFAYVKETGLLESAYVIDGTFQIRPLKVYDGWSTAVDIDGVVYHMPWTLMSGVEAEELCRLAANGPQEGAIVNLGHFEGGSSILLSKSSKLKGREKVYSFDPLRFGWTENLFKKNEVDDWIVFSQLRSEAGVKEWAKRPDPRIRLLLVDGDHTYEGCKRDIIDWSPFLVPGGILCVHDYCKTGPCWIAHQDIVKAVYDAALAPGQFKDCRRVDSLFIAMRK